MGYSNSLEPVVYSLIYEQWGGGVAVHLCEASRTEEGNMGEILRVAQSSTWLRQLTLLFCCYSDTGLTGQGAVGILQQEGVRASLWWWQMIKKSL